MNTWRNQLLKWSPAAVLLLVLTLNLPLRGQELTTDPSITFTQQTTPNTSLNNFLFAISGDSANDIWAVGTHAPGTIGLHFDGSTWTDVPMALSNVADMSGVSVLAPNDVWAVGSAFDVPTQHFTSVIQHFNGKKWTLVSHPHAGGGDQLFAIKAIARNDVIAVGESNSDSQKPLPLIEHFNGIQWTVVTAPPLKPGQTQTLRNIAASSHNDVWITGLSGPVFRAAIMHFDGHRLRNAAFPNLANVNLGGIAAITPNDAWVVGAQASGNVGQSTLTAHWDGTQWTIVPSPNDTSTNALGAVSAISSTDVWAAGCGICGSDAGQGTIIVEHWDGSQWTLNPVPLIGAGDIPGSILALPSGDVFVAATVSGQGRFAGTLVLHGKQGE